MILWREKNFFGIQDVFGTLIIYIYIWKWLKDFIKECNIHVVLEKVKAHNNVKGNEIADQLAKLGRYSDIRCEINLEKQAWEYNIVGCRNILAYSNCRNYCRNPKLLDHY